MAYQPPLIVTHKSAFFFQRLSIALHNTMKSAFVAHSVLCKTMTMIKPTCHLKYMNTSFAYAYFLSLIIIIIIIIIIITIIIIFIFILVIIMLMVIKCDVIRYDAM